MKPIRSLHIFVLVSLFLAIQGPATDAAPVSFYVAPGGNDRWSGGVVDQTPDRSDGPFATLERARDAVRAAKARDSSAGPFTIYLRGGTYYLTQSLVLSPEDSGTADAPVTWQAYENETAIVSGGIRLTHWTNTTINDRPAWKTMLPPQARDISMLRALWINGRRIGRARWPSRGTFNVASVPEKRPNGQYHPGARSFGYRESELKPWAAAIDAEVITTNRWTESHLPVVSIDSAMHLLHFGKQSVCMPDVGDPYWVENVRESLVEPGTFYFDPRERAVYLIPPTGVHPNEAEVVMPLLPRVLQLHGNPNQKRYVEHIHFRGLGFSHAQWYFDLPDAPENGGIRPEKMDDSLSGFGQAAIGVPGAVWGFGARFCGFERCEISHCDTYGIELAQASQHNRIDHCTLCDLGAGAVKIGETVVRKEPDLQASANEVADCTISDGGNLYPSCVAIWIGQSPDNHIIHNDIHGFWYTAISIGWTWGYGPAVSQRNTIEYNEIYHIGIKRDGDAPLLSDMGGIYTLGNQEGTLIRFNRFHDITGLRYGGWGIYFDEGTTHIRAENNLVYRTTHGGFHQHYGKENIFQNNIIAYGRDNQIQRTRLEDHQSFSFTRNIVLWDEGKLLTGNWKQINCQFDQNTYWFLGKGDIELSGKTLAQWQQQGLDEHSRIADPRFANALEGDFRLTRKSNDALAGFVPFDLSTVGPRP